MLGRIEAAFAEQRASEERLRRFVGDASHELRTPLAAVQAYAELFRRGARDRPDDLERAMRGIEQEARAWASSSTTCSCSPGSTRAGRSSTRRWSSTTSRATRSRPPAPSARRGPSRSR